MAVEFTVKPRNVPNSQQFYKKQWNLENVFLMEVDPDYNIKSRVDLLHASPPKLPIDSPGKKHDQAL